MTPCDTLQCELKREYSSGIACRVSCELGVNHVLLEEYGHVRHINRLLLRWYWGRLFLWAVQGLSVTLLMLTLLLQTCLFLLLALFIHCFQSFLLCLGCNRTQMA